MSPVTLRIHELRQLKGWSQAELAERAGVARATINRLELRSPRQLDTRAVDAIALALDVEPGYLLVWSRPTLPAAREKARKGKAK